jgi:hypothetical protein
MKYNYCPVCGEKLPPHHIGKCCNNCTKKIIKDRVVTTLVVTTVAAAAGVGLYYFVKSHQEEVKETAQELASVALNYKVKQLANDTGALLEVAKHAGKLLTRG